MRRPLVFALVMLLGTTAAWADRYSDCFQLKDLDRTIGGCTSVIERGKRESPETRAAAYNIRGLAYGGKGRYDHAIGDFTKAIALKPNDADFYNNRGTAYGMSGEYDLAIADFDKAIALNPKDPEPHYNRGLAYKQKGDKERAIAAFRKLLEINPSNQDAREMLGKLGVTP